MKSSVRSIVCLISILGFLFPVEHSKAQEKSISFDQVIRPILSYRCFACHGPDAEARQADLRLDVADGPDGAHASAIVPGSLEDSELWNRIASEDESEVMPPSDSHKPRLTASELDLFKQWIESGAEYEKFWAFETPATPAVPMVKNLAWSQHPIDLHVLNRLEREGMKPSEMADDRTLVRRVTLDLTGLPPSPNEVQEFLTERSKVGEDAWEHLIDRLLASPRFGEHMARYWLDAVRFADTNGMHKDFYRNNFAYRDWVIRTFNEGLGYDDFLRYQIAGDLFDEPTSDQLIASGFHRLHLIIDRGTALPEESFAKNVHDRVASVGTAMMGLTVHCAQCHDHKYDPITQKDYYSLYAFFNNIDAQPETEFRPPNGLQSPFISFATDEQTSQLEAFDQQLDEADNQIRQLKSELEKLVDEEEKKLHSAKIKEHETNRNSLKRKRDQFKHSIPGAMVMKERPEARETFVLNRGIYDSPGEKVQRDTPSFLPPLNKSADMATRMDLANWMVDHKNPLTPRVAVNRFWQQFFGVGLVKTSEDLGAQGEVPTHPELLDHLAVSFVESGWDVKSLVKQIVMSKTYRQSSKAIAEQIERDPENRLLARGARYRMDAEMIRDQILATSGLLSSKMYGSSVKPPQPDGLWQAVTMTGQRFKPDAGESIYRRSVYTFWKRAMPPPQMTILNAPIRDACAVRRERTNTPSQALLLLNEPEYLNAARHLAKKVLEKESDHRLQYIWEVVTGRIPDEKEKTILQSLLSELTKKYGEEPELAESICAGEQLDHPEAKSALAAWTVVANTIYNLDITKTKE